MNPKGTDGKVLKKLAGKYTINVIGVQDIPLGMHITHEQ
jgi:hypothetical protein